MIERGREIVMEEVVFESTSVTREAAESPSPPGTVPAPQRPEGPELTHRTFVVNPATRPDGLSFVTWWSSDSESGSRQHHCWSNLDWSLFGTGVAFTSGRVRYSVICLPGTLSEDDPGEQKTSPRWLRPSSEMEPSHHLVPAPDARRYRPDSGARRFMRDLHRHVADHHEELRTDLEELKLAGEIRKERREAAKRQPKDLVIRFGLKPRPARQEEDSPATPTTTSKR